MPSPFADHPSDARNRARRGWAVLAASMLLAVALRAGLLETSWGLPAAVMLAVLAAVDSGMLGARRSRLTLGLLVAATLALQLAGALWGSRDVVLWRAASSSTICLLGWAAVLAVLALPSDGSADHAFDSPLSWRVGGVLAVVAGLAVTHYAMRDRYADNVDEVVYLFQGSLLQHGSLGRPLDPALVPHFALRQTYVAAHGLTGQYTPGWPALLAAFGALGLRWWAGVAAGVLGVVSTYLLGARLHSRAVGFLAAAVLATGGVFVGQAGTYLSHAPTLALCVTAAYLMLPEGQAKRASPVRWAAAGLLLGWSVATRPLTGAALGAGIWWWSVARLSWGQARRGTLALLVGSLLPLGGLLAYNAATNGSALRFGFQVAGAGSPGFGVRGIIRYGTTGQPVLDSYRFGPVEAVRGLVKSLGEAARDFGPAGALLPLALLAGSLGSRVRWSRVAPFLLLPAAYAGYYGQGARFYSELLPFVALGVALIIADVRRVSRSRARALILLFLVGQLALAVVRVEAGATAFRRDVGPYLDAVTLAAGRDSVLVVVRDDGRSEALISPLWWFNVESFPGRIVVARETRAGNADLIRAFPNRRLLWLHGTGTGARPQPLIVPLDSVGSR